MEQFRNQFPYDQDNRIQKLYYDVNINTIFNRTTLQNVKNKFWKYLIYLNKKYFNDIQPKLIELQKIRDELYVEWKIRKGGNSGIFYHIKEGYEGPHMIAPEYQLIDDQNYATIHDLKAYNESFGALEPEKLQDWQSTAADYAMHTPDTAEKVLNPAGQWNSTKIVFSTEKVEHWLNGKKVLSFVPWSEDWYKKRDSGKWKNAPDYGKFKTGYIGFQDHGSDLWFRNIKIKKL